jgi:hypothetical protein
MDSFTRVNFSGYPNSCASPRLAKGLKKKKGGFLWLFVLLFVILQPNWQSDGRCRLDLRESGESPELYLQL